MRFRIYYGDATYYDGDESNVRLAPDRNVQAIVYDDTIKTEADVGRLVISGWSLYIYSIEVGWTGTEREADVIDHVNAHTVLAVLRGRWINRAVFGCIIKRAENDPGFRSRSAFDKVEAP